MVLRIAPVLLLAAGASLFAADPSVPAAPQKVTVTHTETLTLPAGGTVRIQHSTGELDIEGWDRADVEITTIKSTQDFFSAADRAKGTAELERVHVSAAVNGKDVVVTTAYPHHAFPLSMVLAGSGVDVAYRIKVPMDAAIVVDHGAGEVNFDHVTGDLQAHVHNGGITLDLPAESQYGIDARAKWGNEIVDFPGKSHRRFWLVGHEFEGGEGAHKLSLRAGFGDIIVLKEWKPDATH